MFAGTSGISVQPSSCESKNSRRRRPNEETDSSYFRKISSTFDCIELNSYPMYHKVFISRKAIDPVQERWLILSLTINQREAIFLSPAGSVHDRGIGRCNRSYRWRQSG